MPPKKTTPKTKDPATARTRKSIKSQAAPKEPEISEPEVTHEVYIGENVKRVATVLGVKKFFSNTWKKYKLWIIGAVALLVIILVYIYRPVKIKEDKNAKAEVERLQKRIDSVNKASVQRDKELSDRTDSMLQERQVDKKKVQTIIIEREKATDNFIRNATASEKQRRLDSLFPPY